VRQQSQVEQTQAKGGVRHRWRSSSRTPPNFSLTMTTCWLSAHVSWSIWMDPSAWTKTLLNLKVSLGVLGHTVLVALVYHLQMRGLEGLPQLAFNFYLHRPCHLQQDLFFFCYLFCFSFLCWSLQEIKINALFPRGRWRESATQRWRPQGLRPRSLAVIGSISNVTWNLRPAPMD
jgi:hypothetical protein